MQRSAASLPGMGAAVESEDREAFLEQFDIFTASCNSCHAAEGVLHFRAQAPDVRQSPIRLD